MGGVDYLPRRPRFEVVYHLLDTAALRRIRLRASPKDDAKPEVPSVAPLWPAAAAAERKFTTCSSRLYGPSEPGANLDAG